MLKKNSYKNLLSIKFFKGKALGKSFETSYKKTKLWVKSLPVGFGTMAPPELRDILDMFGIEDIACGWIGSKNVHTRHRVIFKALMENCETEDDIAQKLGKKLFKKNAAFYKSKE